MAFCNGVVGVVAGVAGGAEDGSGFDTNLDKGLDTGFDTAATGFAATCGADFRLAGFNTVATTADFALEGLPLAVGRDCLARVGITWNINRLRLT